MAARIEEAKGEAIWQERDQKFSLQTIWGKTVQVEDAVFFVFCISYHMQSHPVLNFFAGNLQTSDNFLLIKAQVRMAIR